MSNKPLISVCIANYNGIDLIDNCIESVHAQDCTFAVEIIVHDDASTDDSAKYISTRHPDILFLGSQENVGFCTSNNRMAAVANGEYLLLLNNDAALMPGALTALMKEAIRLPGPAILSLPQYDAQTGTLLDRGSLLDPFLNAIPNLNPARQEVGMVAGACLWIPRKLWEELGGFPEWFGSIAEDLFLCCHARLAGYPVRVLGESGYLHRVGTSFGGGKVLDGRLASTFRRRALSERNKTYVMATVYPSPILQILFPSHLALLLLEGMMLAFLKHNKVYLSTIYLPVFSDLLRQRNQLIVIRRLLMSKRKVSIYRFLTAFTVVPYKLRMWVRHGLPELK